MVGKGESEGGNKTFNLVNLSLWLVGPANGVHPGPNCRVGQGDESTTAEQPGSWCCKLLCLCLDTVQPPLLLCVVVVVVC